MSFFKKIFGSSEKRTYLVIQDAYIECAQVEKGTEVAGANRVNLEKDVVKNGAVKNAALFQEALTALFSEAAPEPITSGSLSVSIPSEQVYSFLKVFSPHTKEEYCQSGLTEVIQAESPFPVDELALDTDHISYPDRLVYGAAGALKAWRRTIEDICQSVGFEVGAFVPEPLALAQLIPAEKPLSFALLSDADGYITLSLFSGGLLYDSFSTDSEADLIRKSQQAFKNFQEHFKEPIHSLYLAEVSPDLQKSFKTAFSDCSADTLQPSEKFLFNLSLALAGLILTKKR